VRLVNAAVCAREVLHGTSLARKCAALCKRVGSVLELRITDTRTVTIKGNLTV